MTNKTDKNSRTSRAGAQLQTEQASTSTNPKRQCVYDQITERITALLEKGIIPWRKPWKALTGLPRNLITRRPYRGINVFLLAVLSYESAFWLTFNQAKQLGGNIRRGEKACPVVFWKQTEVEDKDTGEIVQIPFLRFFQVFNIDQCEGLKNIPATGEVSAAFVRPDAIIKRMPQRPTIRHGMTRAFYSPADDSIAMPSPERFTSQHEYYATLFHELAHSTGHQSRLNRTTLTEGAGLGSNPYCKEELIAEMGAAFLCGHAGLVERTITNAAAYIQEWLQHLRNDKTLLVQAAGQAQKAIDFILGTTFETPHAKD